MGQLLGMHVILGQPVHHGGERDDARRGQDAGLAHATAHLFAHTPRPPDERCVARHHRPHRRAQPLAQADAD